jgi:ketosteroid isomerase-like protein
MARNLVFAITFITALLICATSVAGSEPVPEIAAPASMRVKIAAVQQELRAAILSNDAKARVKLYRADARSMPEYQPALYGTGQIAAYHRTLVDRLKMTRFDPVTSEVFDFGHAALEIGTFTAGWSTVAGGAEERGGKYANVWSVEPDGSLRLKADVWGYFEDLPDPKLFFVAMAEEEPAAGAASAADPRLAEILKTLDYEDARAVRTRDLEARLAFLTEDAVIMPFADTPRHGMGEIRPYLTAYTAAGNGVTFDSVRVWNTGFEDFGDYVIEYSKFHVAWRWPGNAGVTKGGGLHLLRRMPDGSLKRHRQIGTHDHVQ